MPSYTTYDEGDSNRPQRIPRPDDPADGARFTDGEAALAGAIDPDASDEADASEA